MAFYNPTPDRVLAPSHLRVLLAVLWLAQHGRGITRKAVQRRLGHVSPYQVQVSLRALRAHGLIDYEDRSHGTVVPRCYLRLEPVQ